MSKRLLLIWLGVVLAIGTMLFLYKYLGALSEGRYIDMRDPLVSEYTGALGGGVLFFPLYAFMRRFPLNGLRRVPLYALVAIAYGIADTTFMWITRIIIFPIVGLGHYNYGRMPMRYFMEFPVQLLGFCLVVALVHITWRVLRASQLEASLARAELQSLRLQLQPHFLFNAMNTISSVMYSDPAAADEMLDRLSELLRVSLRTTQSDEVTLAEELNAVDAYLAIMKARFGERLDVRTDIDPKTRSIYVPSMIVQPLIENAVRHGNAERSGRGAIVLRTREEGNMLTIEIDDDGPGSDLEPKGVGLTSTVQRLRILYGDRYTFEGKRAGDVFRVALRIPVRR